jgi:hypothetical protein
MHDLSPHKLYPGTATGCAQHLHFPCTCRERHGKMTSTISEIIVILTFFVLWLERSTTSRAKKSDRPPSPCGLHSLMTLDAVQPGSLIPAPSISSKLEVCNKESKNQPHKHTHKRWTGWMPWGCWKGSSLFAAKEHVLQYVPFQIVWICASSLFSQIALCCIFSQGQGGMQRIKCWERPQSLILRWSFQHAVLATDAELTPAMAMCLQFRVGHVFQSKQS